MVSNDDVFPELKIGDKGDYVRRWQKFLVQNQGIKLDPESMAFDGIYGPGTANGTKNYQTIKDLTVTGIVDSKTFNQALKDAFNVNMNILS